MDSEDFAEVMGNLLDNARLWARGAVMVSVVPAEAGALRVAVEDDGPGIAPGLGGVRGESAAPPGEGHGLGLAIVGDVLALYGTALETGRSAAGGCRAAFAVAGWVGEEA